MSENTENNPKTKAETTKIDGVSAQINLSRNPPPLRPADA